MDKEMRYRAAVATLVFIGFAGLPRTSPAEDVAAYSEYLPAMAPSCEKPLLNATGVRITLERCEVMYEKNNYIEGRCERVALSKQRTASHLLQEYDAKWLANIVNRKKACMDLLENNGKLGLWDTISRWWNDRSRWWNNP
jgi:hypothetical protein